MRERERVHTQTCYTDVSLSSEVLPDCQPLNLMFLHHSNTSHTLCVCSPFKVRGCRLTTRARMMFFRFRRTLLFPCVELRLLGACGTAKQHQTHVKQRQQQQQCQQAAAAAAAAATHTASSWMVSSCDCELWPRERSSSFPANKYPTGNTKNR